MKKINIPDAEIAVWRTGKGDPVMLVSGLGGKASFWANVIPLLSNSFEVISHDHRGTGQSSRSDIDYSIKQMASDVIFLMDALNINKAHFLGHSTGGAIAQFLGINHPDRVISIVLSSTWAGPDDYFKSLFNLRLRILEYLGPEQYIIDGILRAYPAKEISQDPKLIRDVGDDRLKSFPGVKIESSRIRAVMSHNLRNKLNQMNIPTLVICAEDDQITPIYFSRELVDLIPAAESIFLKTGGHFFPILESKVYTEEIKNFFNKKRF